MNSHRIAGSVKRALVVGSAVVAAAGGGTIAAPSALGLSHATTDVATSQSLQSSFTHVTSSTGKKLRVQLTANQVVGVPSASTAMITVRKGSARSETHAWNFEVATGALTLDDTGAGTVDVPGSAISPYGEVSLTVTPVGDPTTQQCQGQDVSQTQKVSLSGTFYFDTRSGGKHAWGAVGSKSKPFTFSATNSVVSQFNPSANIGCVDFNNLPCASGLTWSSNQNSNLDFDGFGAGKHGQLFASRTVNLSTPAGATRDDEAFATTKPLKVVKKSGGASLSVTAATNAVGSAKLTAKKSHKDSNNCKLGSKKKVATSTSWQNAKYKNGKKKLAVHAEIFGAIKIANNANSSFSVTTLS